MNDICVVGAGPAGISCARELRRHGCKVVLLDRSERPGDKACGGGLTEDAWEPAGIDPARVPDHARAFHRLVVGDKSVETDGPFVVVLDRKKWQAARIDELREIGCDVRLKRRFMGFSRGEIRTDGGSFRCDVLIGADGASSRVRRLLRIPTGLVVRAWQVTVPSGHRACETIEREAVTVRFDHRLFGSGYAWVFPTVDGVRLGCGASSAFLRAGDLRASFLSWLKELGVRKKDGRVRCGTIGCGYAGHRFKNVFLAGDAAGLASPVTGEGIASALISGREVAREIVDPSYRSKEIPRLAARHRRTHDLLSIPWIGRSLYRLAPSILRIPFIRTEAMGRYG